MTKLAVFVLSGLASGCATLFTDSSQNIRITSNVDNAEVLLDGEPIGRTPITFELDKDTFKHHEVTLREASHESRTVRIKKSLETVAIFNCTSFLSWGTDAITGAMMEYSPGSYYIELPPKAGKRSEIEQRLMQFLVMNHDPFLRDVARGDGEYITIVAELAGVSGADYEDFADRLARRMPRMTLEEYPHRIYYHVVEVRSEMRAARARFAGPGAPVLLANLAPQGSALP